MLPLIYKNRKKVLQRHVLSEETKAGCWASWHGTRFLCPELGVEMPCAGTADCRAQLSAGSPGLSPKALLETEGGSRLSPRPLGLQLPEPVYLAAKPTACVLGLPLSEGRARSPLPTPPGKAIPPTEEAFPPPDPPPRTVPSPPRWGVGVRNRTEGNVPRLRFQSAVDSDWGTHRREFYRQYLDFR